MNILKSLMLYFEKFVELRNKHKFLTMFFLTALNLSFNIPGMYLIKSAENYWTLTFWCGIVLFIICIAIWFVMLRLYEISTMVAIATSIGTTTTAIAFYFIFVEYLNKIQIAGLAIIIIGILLITEFSIKKIKEQ